MRKAALKIMHAFGIQMIALAACLWAAAAMPLHAQAPAAAPAPATPADAAAAAQPGQVNVLNDLAKQWKDMLESMSGMITAVTVFLGLLTALLIAFTKLLQAWRDLDKERRQLKAERQFFAGDILQAEPQALSATRKGIDYQIVLLGDRSVGKTTFLRLLSQNPRANTRAATGEPKTFGFSLTSYEPGNWENVRFLVEDYAGQSPGEIAAAASLASVSSERPRSGAAIFLLDISPTVVGTGEVEPGTKFNQDGTYSPARLRTHVNKWNSDGLSHVQAHLRGRVKFNYVCCFINKMDLARQWTVAEEEEISKKLTPLFDAVKSHPLFNRDCFFEVIFGTLAVNERLDGPMRRDRLAVGCNLPLLWSRLVEQARHAAPPN